VPVEESRGEWQANYEQFARMIFDGADHLCRVLRRSRTWNLSWRFTNRRVCATRLNCPCNKSNSRCK
jgi:hypothetical protein